MSTTASSHSHSGEVPCPDPSVHSRLSRDSDLQNNASKAALLAAESKRTSSAQSERVDPLGPDGRLSSGAAASSLKYAKAQDLPSFPSVGIDATQSGNKAANLANTNYKSPAYPSVDSSSSSASKAATLAANKGGHLDLWQYKPEATSNSAAHLAMGKNLGVELDRGYTEEGHKKALLAATLSTRKKNNAPPPVEEPPVYPDSGNASYNALNAASVAHRPSTKYQPMSDKGLEASRIYHQQPVAGSMYGSAPPVALEEDEKRHQAALHAAAVTAAKQLYEIEKPAMERIAAGDYGAKKAYDEAYTATPGDDRLRMQAMNYVKVQEAAQRLAAERLAKLDPDGARAYRDHYGVSTEKPTSRLSVRGSRRGNRDSKAMNDDLDSSDDEAQASRIRGRTRGLNEQVATLDEQKRTQDRKDLMAAAQAKVKASMTTMDDHVFNATGKMSPAMAKEWNEKARAKAEAESSLRMANHGKVHIGGGRYMDQSEVDAIAQERMQPTLDEITRTAAAQRAREEEIALNAQRLKEEQQAEKQRQQEVKAHTRMLDAQEKARLQAEKDADKAEQKRVRDADKEAAKQRVAEEKAQKDETKRVEREAKEQERLNEATLRTAQREQERADAAEKKAEVEADKARAAEAEAAEKEADAERLAAEKEAEKERAEENKRSTEVTSPDFSDAREVTSGEAIRTSVDTPADPTATRRESKLRGFFSKMRGPKKEKETTYTAADESPEAIAAAEKYKSGTGEAGQSAELSARAKGKQPADADAASEVSSLKSEEISPTRGRESTVSDDKWSEARDTVEEPPPRVSSSPARVSGSKFQEDL